MSSWVHGAARDVFSVFCRVGAEAVSVNYWTLGAWTFAGELFDIVCRTFVSELLDTGCLDFCQRTVGRVCVGLWSASSWAFVVQTFATEFLDI